MACGDTRIDCARSTFRAVNNQIIGNGKGVEPTILSPEDLVGTRLDGDIGTGLSVAGRYSVCREGNRMATEYTGIN